MKNNTFLTFCIKVVLILVIIFGVDRFVGYTFVKMKDLGLKSNPENMWLKTPFTVEKMNADVVVIGSSKATHNYVPQILEEALGMTTYNCGQDGCFFLYQNCIVNMILDRYCPKQIVWDIQPESFISKDKSSQYQNIRYLSPYYADNEWVKLFVDGESEKMPVLMRSRMYAYNSKLLNYLFPLFFHSTTTDNGYIPLPNDGYTAPEMHDEIEDKSLVASLDYLDLLNATLKRCREKQTDVYLVISPEFSRKSIQTKSAERAICEQAVLEGFHCYDFLSNEVFMKDSSLFKDDCHLNDKGARLYTELVARELTSNM